MTDFKHGDLVRVFWLDEVYRIECVRGDWVWAFDEYECPLTLKVESLVRAA